MILNEEPFGAIDADPQRDGAPPPPHHTSMSKRPQRAPESLFALVDRAIGYTIE